MMIGMLRGVEGSDQSLLVQESEIQMPATMMVAVMSRRYFGNSKSSDVNVVNVRGMRVMSA